VVEQRLDKAKADGSLPSSGTIVKCIAEQTNGGEPMSSAFHYGVV
jgi:hypothetical protein